MIVINIFFSAVSYDVPVAVAVLFSVKSLILSVLGYLLILNDSRHVLISFIMNCRC